MYAGVVCRKCYKGCNHDTEIKFLKNTYENLEKRFGGYVCSDCGFRWFPNNNHKYFKTIKG